MLIVVANLDREAMVNVVSDGVLVTILLAAGNVSRLTGQVFLSLIAWQHLIFLAPKLQGNLSMPFRRGVQRPRECCPKVPTRVRETANLQ